MGFSSFAASLIDHLGLVGVAIGVFLNGLSIPGLSEVLLPLSGLAVARGQLNLAALLVAAMTAQLAGVSVAYLIGRRGGVPVIERYGKYVLISHHHLLAAHRAFERYGGRLVVVMAFIPGLQGLVGYVAGIAEMQYSRFLLAVFVGKVVWIGGLVYAGSVLGDHVTVIDQLVKEIGLVMLVVLAGGVAWYIWRHQRRSE
jgi:membrane protein DedA with SNARE-associated domain